MKRYKKRTAGLFHITVWSIIIFLSIYILIQCVKIFGMETKIKAETYEEPKENTISTTFNYMMQSSIPILDYVNDQNNNNSHSLLNLAVRIFPINRYIADTEDEQIFEENEDTIILTTDIGGTNLGSIMPIDIIHGEIFREQGDSNNGTSPEIDVKEAMSSLTGESFTVEQLLNRTFLYNNFYIVDKSTKVDDDLFNAKEMLEKDMTMKQQKDKPQILIYHTHSQEAFSDSRPGVEEDTIVGVGTHLAQILTEEYGYNVIHDKTYYDIVNGSLDRNLAYNKAEPGITKILEENPTIEVVIDLHRDDGNGKKRVTKINGVQTAQIMLFNGLSTNSKGESITYLDNPNLQNNLAFGLKLQLEGREKYPGLFIKNYLKAYRYNLHVRAKSILAETGTDSNTVDEAINAMDFLADILHNVLSGES
ncbi:MAG: putative rane protein [Anaerocolumna sp.]|jgi:stage II sporulation protein P|nr:putative rane protein [Anaerocolumna sp.]